MSLPQVCARTVRPNSSRCVANEALSNPIQHQIDNRRRIERHDLAEDEPTDDADPERHPELSARAGCQRQWQCTEERCERGHHDRAKTQPTRFGDCGLWRETASALGID